MPLLGPLLSRLRSLFELDLDLADDPLGDAFHPITPTVTLGRRPRPDQVEALQALGIRRVVSCLPESEREAMAFLGDDFETLFLPLRDGVHEDIGAALSPFLAFVASATSGERVLVHCEVGVSRSATLAIAHVMASGPVRFHEAFLQVRRRRPQVLPNVAFASALQRFEHTLFPPRTDGYASLTRYLHDACAVPVSIDVLQGMLEAHDFDALRAIRAIFGDEVPRVVQGVRR